VFCESAEGSVKRRLEGWKKEVNQWLFCVGRLPLLGFERKI
jgi:hypothetical protein